MDLKNKEIIVRAKMTSKNQITIPKEIRNRLRLDRDDYVDFVENKDGSIQVKKENSRDLWKIVAEQEKKYGSVSTPELDWGEDVGAEDFD